MRRGHVGYEFLTGLYENSFSESAEVALDPEICQGMGGNVLLAEDTVLEKG